MIIVTSSLSKSSVFKMFSVHAKTKPAFSNSSGLKSVFEKRCFCDGLVRTEGLTNRRNKATFLNFFGVVWTRRQVYAA